MKSVMAITVVFIYFNSTAQCKIGTSTRDDGVTIKYITPVPIGHDNNVVAAFGLETNGRDFFVTLWVVYTNESKMATGILILNFDNRTSVRLPIYNSQKTIIKGMNAAISTYSVESSKIILINDHRLKSIGFQEVDNTLRVVPAEEYQTIISDDFYCLQKNK
jgi:hypothetical protein